MKCYLFSKLMNRAALGLITLIFTGIIQLAFNSEAYASTSCEELCPNIKEPGISKIVEDGQATYCCCIDNENKEMESRPVDQCNSIEASEG